MFCEHSDEVLDQLKHTNWSGKPCCMEWLNEVFWICMLQYVTIITFTEL